MGGGVGVVPVVFGPKLSDALKWPDFSEEVVLKSSVWLWFVMGVPFVDGCCPGFEVG